MLEGEKSTAVVDSGKNANPLDKKPERLRLLMSEVSQESNAVPKGSGEQSEEAKHLENEHHLRLIVFRTIVQLSDTVETNFLLEKLNNLDVNSWADVVEERYLGRLCGIPVCANPVEVRRYQKYRIDTKNKKVFERCTERDRFCSDKCFKRAVNIRLQLAEEPLWLRGIAKRKKYVIDDSPRQPLPSKQSSSSVEYVREHIEKRLGNLIVGESADTDEDSEKSGGEMERKKDDESFINEISNFLQQKPQPVVMEPTSTASATTPSNSSTCYTASDIDAFPALHANESALNAVESDSSRGKSTAASSLKTDSITVIGAEKLARIRDKYSAQKTKRPPVIVDAKPLDVSLAKKVNKFEIESFSNFVRDYCGDETLDYLRRRGRADAVDLDEEQLTEAEELLKRFYAGEKVVERTNDRANLPRIDSVDQNVLRKDVFARLMKPSWFLLEKTLKKEGLYQRVQPLIGTLRLSAANVDLKKSEAQLFAAFLFRLLAYCEEKLGDEFFPEDRACSSFRTFVEDSCCDFSVFDSVVSDLLRNLQCCGGASL